MARKNDKHFLIYYSRRAGTFVVTEPRTWANANRGYFPEYTFETTSTKHHPSTEKVEERLISDFHFEMLQTGEVTVLFNMDTTLDL